MDAQLSSFAALSHSQKAALRKGNIRTVFDLLALPIQDIVKRCRIAHHDAQELVQCIYDELDAPPLYSLDREDLPRDEVITTGDTILDKVLGGGIRTRKLWEVTGESAAGKTQLAMQLALCVQIPGDLGGVSGGACFLSTSWTLPTNRLVEIVHNHPVLSPAFCGLADIHTMKTPTIPLLLHALSNTFPPFLEERASDPNTKPIKLLVIDAITELFHSEDRVSVSTLSERSRNLTEIATLLHTLTHKHGLAVVVLNEVSDVFDRGPPPGVRAHELIYRDQARLFGRADAGWGAKKEAALGLVWANQINARIMLVRTERMRVLDETEYRPAKRRRMEDGAEEARTRVEAEAVRIRRLDVIFNSVGHPASLDYIITSGGFVALEPEEEELSHNSVQPTVRTQNLSDVLEEVCPFDLPLAVPSSSAGPSSDLISSLPSSGNFAPAVDMAAQNGGEVEEGPDPEDGPVEEDDEWEAYWKDGDIGSDIYSQVDLDALSSVK